MMVVNTTGVADELVRMPPAPVYRDDRLLPNVPVIWLVPFRSMTAVGPFTPTAVVVGAPPVSSSGRVLSPPLSLRVPAFTWVWPVYRLRLFRVRMPGSPLFSPPVVPNRTALTA